MLFTILDVVIDVMNIVASLPCKEVKDEQGEVVLEHPIESVAKNVDVHCKAFTVGFVSTAFTLLPFIIAYGTRHNQELDPSKVVIGLAEVSALGGVVFTAINRGDKTIQQEYERVFEFIQPYIPMVVGGAGRRDYEPVFQEMCSDPGVIKAGNEMRYGSSQPSVSNSNYKPGLASSQSNRPQPYIPGERKTVANVGSGHLPDVGLRGVRPNDYKFTSIFDDPVQKERTGTEASRGDRQFPLDPDRTTSVKMEKPNPNHTPIKPGERNIFLGVSYDDDVVVHPPIKHEQELDTSKLVIEKTPRGGTRVNGKYYPPEETQFGEAKIGRTIVLQGWNDPYKTGEIVDVDVLSVQEVMADAKRDGDDLYIRKEDQENFEFDRDAVYEFDTP